MKRLLLSEEFSHIVITAAKVNALWTVVFALEVNALGQFFKGLLMRLLLLLSKEETTECLMEACVKRFKFMRSYDRVIGIGTFVTIFGSVL